MSIAAIMTIKMTLRRAALSSGFLVLIGMGGLSNAWAADTCDPLDKQNDRARDLRLSGKLTDAQVVVDRVLKTRPDDFRANYTAALIALDRAGGNRTARVAGIQQLTKVSLMLAKQDQSCAVAKNFYSIYNTIGVEYFNLGDVASAKSYFLKANEHKGSLNSDTSRKLSDNLGLIMFRENNYPCANAYFKQASDANLANGKAHFDLTQRILKSASDSTTCKNPFKN